MLFMVIETFRNGKAEAVYRRFHEQGRMQPDRLKYLDSWIDVNLERCFQLMECDDVRLLQQWVARWHDLMEFEIVPVTTSLDTKELLKPAS
ncbi:MAG TPA: DUF3303 family protein [Pirellulales bacterium]|nr:DUF3303 family protein [Pirellulales bacterium]